MRAPTTPFIVLLLALACLVRLAEPFLVPPTPATHHPRRRHIIPQASASTSSSGPFPPINVELLRASLRLLGTHERQKAQDWEDSLFDAGRQMALAKLMAQLCDTRLALLDFAEEHIRRDYGIHGPSTTVWGHYARTEEGQKWRDEFERIGVFKDTPIEVLEEEGLAGVLEEAVEAIEADEETEAGESEAEEESWVGEAWETAEQVVKENAEKVGGKVVGRWTGPEEWERTAMGDKHGDKGTREERMPEEWEMGEREADAQAQTVPEGWEMGEQVEGESELGSQTGWEVGEASEGKAQPDMTEEGWLD